MSRRESRGLLFARIERSIRNFSSPFARGNGQFAGGEDVSKSLIHSVRADFREANRSESPVVEVEDVEFDHLCAQPVKRGLHKHARMSASLFELSPKEQRRFSNFMRMGIKGEENSRGCHNFGRKPQRSTRQTIRDLRQLSHGERLAAGERMNADGEQRRARRRARASMRPLAEVFGFPTRTSHEADESAAA